MATKNITAAEILANVHTGLVESDDTRAFSDFVESELGAIRAMGRDQDLSKFSLKGKGEKSRGVYRGAEIEFKGRHNAATLCIHFGLLLLRESNALGILPPKADLSQTVGAWKAARDHKAAERAERAARMNANQPEAPVGASQS